VAGCRAVTILVSSSSCWLMLLSNSLALTAASAPRTAVTPEVPMPARNSAATPFLTRFRISCLVLGARSSCSTPF
jgi:hypothetical protein